MKSAIEVMIKISTDAKATAKATPVKYGALAPGDYHRQGDVYITRIHEIPKGAIPIDNPSAQLAPGDTQGSRHVIDDLSCVEMFAKKDQTALDGPILNVKQPITINHPEHGAVSFPAGFYAITYQRQLADELRRVQD